jgi:hypothetical protein
LPPGTDWAEGVPAAAAAAWGKTGKNRDRVCHICVIHAAGMAKLFEVACTHKQLHVRLHSYIGIYRGVTEPSS